MKMHWYSPWNKKKNYLRKRGAHRNIQTPGVWVAHTCCLLFYIYFKYKRDQVGGYRVDLLGLTGYCKVIASEYLLS